MQVIDRRQVYLVVVDVAIVAAPGLPESPACCLSFHDGDLGNPLRNVFFEPANSAARNLFFNKSLKLANDLARITWADKKMNMLAP